jgi:DNA-binding SARP family transcriptional activator
MNSETALHRATSKLRAILTPAGQQSLLSTRERFALPDQAFIWVDADAAEAMINAAEMPGVGSSDRIPLLEAALALFQRGTYLEHEDGIWCLGRRGELERLASRCHHWLADAYLATGNEKAAEQLANALLRHDPLNERAIIVLLQALYRQGFPREALQTYQQAKSLYERNTLPFPAHIDTVYQKLLRDEDREPYEVNQSKRQVQETKENSIQAHERYTESQKALLQAGTFSLDTPSAEQAELEWTITSSLPFFLKHVISQHTSLDLVHFRERFLTILHLHRTSTAQQTLQELSRDIHSLEQYVRHIQAEELSPLREIIYSNALLAAKIAKDQNDYILAYAYAYHAIRFASASSNDALLAVAHYLRGCVSLEWGLFGSSPHDMLKRIGESITDYQHVLKLAQESETVHAQLRGLTMLQLSRAQGALARVMPSIPINVALDLADEATNMIARQPLENPQTCLLMTGTLSGLHQGGYHLMRASIWNMIGVPEQAIIELSHLQRLQTQTYARDETRSQAWSILTFAEALLRLGEYPEALRKTKDALVTCQAIHSLQNITMITQIYQHFLTSSYGNKAEVREIGDMLYEWYGKTIFPSTASHETRA